MLQQLSYFLLLALVSAQCFSPSPIPALSTYTVLVTNAQAGTTNSQYTIASKNKNTQLAICNNVNIIAISSMQAVNIFSWRLAVKSKNDSTLTLAFYHIDASWISVGGVVWQTSSPELIVGSSTLSGNMGSEMYRLPLKQNIRNQQASVAIIFVNGINANQVKQFELSVRAVRIADKSIYVNITTQKQVYKQLKGIHVSFIVFSPIYASFDSYGDSLTYFTNKQEQYTDVYNDMPPTSYKIYGMTSWHVRNQPSTFYFSSVLSSSYVLMVSNNVSDITIDYLYLVSAETSCQSCGQSQYLYNDSCVATCPEGSILGNYQNIQFCRICPSSLNLVANQVKGVCECGQGYEMGKQSRCIEVKNTSPNKTLQVTKFIPAELLKRDDNINKNQVKEEAKNSVIDRKSVNQSSDREVKMNTQVDGAVKLQVSSLTKNDNAAAKTDSLAASKIEASPNKISASLPNPTTRAETAAIKPQASTLPKTDNPNTNTKSVTPPSKDSKQVPTPNTPKPPANLGIPVVKPIIPILVTTGSPTSSPLSLPNCSLIANSTLIASSCVCQIGFINISNHCVPLMDMVLNTAIPSTLKVSTSVSCLLNQIFSISQNRCVCAPGFRMSGQNVCEKSCGINERMNTTDNTCRCVQGYTRINDVCQLCKVNGTFFGNQTCYLLTNSTVCRKNYTQSNGFCLRCLNITKYSLSNNTCLNCEDGLIYNGSSCFCPAKSNFMNGTCYSPRCGDKIVQTDEACDDGNVINYDGCSSTCFIQSGWSCLGGPSKCVFSRCGDGIINGGEFCDDGNTYNGDGCSQLCLVQPNYSCVSKPSSCYPYQTGNLTLISVLTNTNIVYIELQTPQYPALSDPQLPPSFIKLVYLSKNQMVPTSYCRQQQGNLYRFMCLLIYPSGIPNQKVHVLYRYSWAQLTGSVLFEVDPGVYVPGVTRGKTVV